MGFLNEKDPLGVGIELADGKFIARDWLLLRLQADLVTLSACSTGKSIVRPGDDLVGLTRAVLSAGASSLLTCLWEVNAITTLDWMSQFYENMENTSDDHDHQTPAKIAAFREATLALKKMYSDPYFWAPFVLVGNHS